MSLWLLKIQLVSEAFSLTCISTLRGVKTSNDPISENLLIERVAMFWTRCPTSAMDRVFHAFIEKNNVSRQEWPMTRKEFLTHMQVFSRSIVCNKSFVYFLVSVGLKTLKLKARNDVILFIQCVYTNTLCLLFKFSCWCDVSVVINLLTQYFVFDTINSYSYSISENPSIFLNMLIAALKQARVSPNENKSKREIHIYASTTKNF